MPRSSPASSGLAALLGASSALAQTPTDLAQYTRPQRVSGTVIVAPPPRTTPPSERRLTAPPGASPGALIGPRRWGPGAIAGLTVAAVGAAITLVATREPKPRERNPRTPTSTHPGMELRRVTLALLAGVRTAIEHELAPVAQASLGSPEGRHALAVALRDALVQRRGALVLGAFQGWSLDPGRAAESLAFTTRTLQEKAQRVVQTPTRPDDTAALSVVSVVVLARGALPALPQSIDARNVLVALEAAIPPKPGAVAALEVLWSPPSSAAALHEQELITVMPELMRLEGAARVAQRACSWCRCPLRAELTRCPACGGS